MFGVWLGWRVGEVIIRGGGTSVWQQEFFGLSVLHGFVGLKGCSYDPVLVLCEVHLDCTAGCGAVFSFHLGKASPFDRVYNSSCMLVVHFMMRSLDLSCPAEIW